MPSGDDPMGGYWFSEKIVLDRLLICIPYPSEGRIAIVTDVGHGMRSKLEMKNSRSAADSSLPNEV
jgi:hypothetical protein